MLSKFVLAAVLAVSSGLGAAQAQSLASIGGPAELPPASFDGQQYVDSRGCVFLRAGVAGRVTWAPRLDRSRRVLCGYPPTFGARPAPVAVAEAAPTPAPAPTALPRVEPEVGTAPMATVASAIPRTTPAAPVRVAPAAPAPVVVAEAPPVVVAPSTGTTGRRIGCFTNTPVPVRVQLTNGGTAVLCTRGDGTLEGARAPIYPPGSGPGASLTEPQFAARGNAGPTHIVTASGAGQTSEVVHSSNVPNPPPGYRTAWDDDRLNPNRARGTAEGQAMQDQVWTRETPARLVSEVAAEEAPRATVTASTKTEPSAPVRQQASANGLYVQVGTFGVPENAAGARNTLQSLGLATARANITQGGRALTIVLAGPFGSSGEAQAALNAARGAGFSDAFIR
jgi:hypothetical protein